MSVSQKAVRATNELNVADPGDAKTINSNGCVGSNCVLVTGASNETRTLGNPSIAGETIFLTLKTHGGGNVDVTVTTGLYVGTRDSTHGALARLDFDVAGDSAMLRAVDVSGTLNWSLESNMGSIPSSP